MTEKAGNGPGHHDDSASRYQRRQPSARSASRC